jgi:hypothetical protein
MSMTRKRAIEAMVGKHREALARSQNFRCACCEGIYPSKEASHVAAYDPQNKVMGRLVPVTNIATYVVCQECARLPEATVFMRVEKFLVKSGLLRTDLKPLDAPGGHSPGHQKQHKHGPNCSHGGRPPMLRNN